MRIFALSFLSLTFVVSSGCFPARGLKAFGASGTVIDAKAQKPVAGASVRVSGQEPVLTAHDGSFFVKEKRKWFIFVLAPLPQDPPSAVIRPTMTVNFDGYEQRSIQLREMIRSGYPVGQDGDVQVGTVELNRVSPGGR